MVSLLKAMNNFVPTSKEGWNIRPKEQPLERDTEEFKNWKEKLGQSPFHLMKHKDLENNEYSTLSLVHILKVDTNMILCDVLNDEGKQQMTAIPGSGIIDLLPIAIESLLHVQKYQKKFETVGRQMIERRETNSEYFSRFVCPFILEQGFQKLWDHNKQS